MRVLMLSPAYPPEGGGVQTHVRAVSQVLVRFGHEVTVVTACDRPDLAAEESDAGVRVLRVPPADGGGRATNAAIRRWLGRHRSRLGDFDVVHAHDYVTFVSWLLPNAWRWRSARWFVTFHGYERYPIARRDLWLRRLCARLARGVITVGSFIPRWYGTPATAVTYGAAESPPPEAASRWTSRGGEQVEVSFVGRLDRDTGISTVVEAMSLLPADIRPLLRVVGDGPLRPEVEARAASLGAVFHGWLADPWAPVSAGSIVFAPGYLSILEAWVRALPVVAIYDDPLREDYYRSLPHSDAGLVLAGDAGAAADAIMLLLGDASARRRMPGSAAVWAKTQTWEVLARLYLRLWSDGEPGAVDSGGKDDLASVALFPAQRGSPISSPTGKPSSSGPCNS